VATFVIGTIVFTLLSLAVRSMFKKYKNNEKTCGCNCPGCFDKENCSNELKFKNK
jgi:hypothetical protein